MKNRVSSVGGSGSWQAATTSSVLLPSNVWTHVAVTYTNGTVKFYVNGELTDTIARTYTMGSNGQPVLFSHSTQAFNGWMDDVRLYPFVLKPHEIRALTGMREYAYDAKGNLTDDRVWTYSYDYENRLTSATNDAVSVFYRYDSLGRLIERRTSGASVTTNRMYYAGWQLIAEYNGAGTLQAKYVYGPGIDEPVRMTRGTTNYYYHPDGLGSVTEVTTNGGFKVESYTYDVYGTPTIYNAAGTVIGTSALGNRLLFTGRDRDPDTALYNYRFRYYSPSLGRFVQPDPSGFWGEDLNLYRYVKNNPASYIDPSGAEAQRVSITYYNKGGVMVHAEVPKPGAGTGNVHIQVGGAKYFFNTKLGAFENLPKELAQKLQTEKKFRKAIGRAVERVNCEGGGFAPKYGGGIGKFIPIVAAGLALASSTEHAAAIDQAARDYFRELRAGRDASVEAAQLRILLNNVVTLSGELVFPTLLKNSN